MVFVNLNSQQNRIRLQILFISIFGLGLLLLAYLFASRRSPLDAEAVQGANSTKTALAMTAGALLGPFPTSTVPTTTASDTPTLTPTLPTVTPSVTRTPTPTQTLILTFTTRTNQPRSTTLPTSIPSRTPIPPSKTPVKPTIMPTIKPTNTAVIILPTLPAVTFYP